MKFCRCEYHNKSNKLYARFLQDVGIVLMAQIAYKKRKHTEQLYALLQIVRFCVRYALLKD